MSSGASALNLPAAAAGEEQDPLPVAPAREGLETGAEPALVPLDEARRAFERDYLVRILKITAGNVTRAARLAGRNRTEFYRLLERYSLAPSMFKASARSDRANAGASAASRDER